MTCEHNLTTSFGPSSTVNPELDFKEISYLVGIKFLTYNKGDFKRISILLLIVRKYT